MCETQYSETKGVCENEDGPALCFGEPQSSQIDTLAWGICHWGSSIAGKSLGLGVRIEATADFA